MSDVGTGSGRKLLRDLIDIPERVQTNDFVLKLSEGVTEARAAETIKNYVVTTDLAKAFDKALGFIQGAVEGGKSAACYLHGSFGAGKSHFTAVLNLLLAGNVRARSVPELAGVVTKPEKWLGGKRFLMVPYHMIGAKDVTSAILAGYASHVRKVEPSAPTPGFYLGEKLFEDARGLRAKMGNGPFFQHLNEAAAASDDGWGDFGNQWDAGSFEAATLEAPEGEERQRLVGRLIEGLLQQLRRRGGDARRGLRGPRRRPRDHDPARQAARLRRRGSFLGRADPLARQPRRGCGLRQ